jgi:YopX protein
MKLLCKGSDCFKNVTVDEFTEHLPNGEPHPLALLCDDCAREVNASKKLKRFRKNQSKKSKVIVCIKYRVWDKKKKMWTKNIVVDAEGYIWWGYGSKLLNPDDFVVCLYTGRKDKNGKSLFQGDLVSVKADEEGYGPTSYGGIVEITSEECGYSINPIKPTLEEREQQGKPWDSSSC